MLVSDDDGHRYVIPVHLKAQFDRYVEVTEDGDGDIGPGEDFEEYRLEGGLLTFTDPKVN